MIWESPPGELLALEKYNQFIYIYEVFYRKNLSDKKEIDLLRKSLGHSPFFRLLLLDMVRDL